MLTCLANSAKSSSSVWLVHMSSLILGSRGVVVASSHFSNINATKEKSGCLIKREYTHYLNYKIFLSKVNETI
jgi:hypothetical protein